MEARFPHGLSPARPNDVTIEAPPLDTRRPENAAGAPACARVQLVEGSGPCFSSETQGVLRSRLRLAALALCFGFAAFFAWQLIYVDIFSRLEYQIIVAAHFAVMLLLGFAGASLCRSCTIGTSKLRTHEALIFGLPAAYFGLVQTLRMQSSAADSERFLQAIPSSLAESPPLGTIWFPLGPWLLLMFTYALFIPNTWRRAAVVVGLFAAAPIAVTVILAAMNPVCAAAFSRESMEVTQYLLALVVAAGIATIGVKTIGALRTEAFEAKQLGQYRLRRLLGAGGMGEVYLAEHQLLKRPCAIKLIRPEKAGEPQALARFEREVQSAARLSHWNSIEIFDYGRTNDGVFYYVMEYLPGLNLQELVDRYGPLSPARAIHFLRQTCRALQEAHAMGLLHRDIKPGNIFAAQRGGVYDVAKLLDFGLVKPISQTGISLELTQEGAVTGSPLYMAPEQASGDSTDARSDVYALGCVGYFLLTGRPPFVDQKAVRVLMAHMGETPAPPSELREGVPVDLEQVLLKCLAKSPDDRFASAADLEAALAECGAADEWTDAEAALWWSSRDAHPAMPEAALVGA
jgi:eukaryotic-like serine/threonine-protein kinase